MLHYRTIYLQALQLLLLLPVVASFIVTPNVFATTKTLSLQKQSLQLNLHVDPIHLHRDSLLRLDDPMFLKEEIEPNDIWSTKEIHKFTNSLAPLVLAMYLIGYYLSNYHANDEMTHAHMDPMFGGGILIGVGLYLMKWIVDNTFLSPP